MPVIKRYPNRKLYDTEAKKYITLEGISDLIRQGQEVQVLDHATNEDLTTVTLTQIIFEQEKKQTGFLPKSVLTGLVQAGGETMNVLRRSLSYPLDLFRHVDEEIEKRIQALVSQGELAREEAIKWRDQLIGRNRPSVEPAITPEEELERLIAARGIPTRQEIQRLMEHLDALASRLDDISDEKK